MKSTIRFVASALLTIGLLSSAIAFAGAPSKPSQSQEGQSSVQQDDSDKNICYIIGENYRKCLRAHRYCFWDSEDGRCEPLNDTSYCGRLDQYSCEAHSNCFWDYEDGRCETVN